MEICKFSRAQLSMAIQLGVSGACYMHMTRNQMASHFAADAEKKSHINDNSRKIHLTN